MGIFLGVASLLINISFIRAMQADVKTNMEKAGGLKLVTVSSVSPVSSTEKMQFQRSPGLTMQDADAALKTIPYFESVVKQKDLSWGTFKSAGKNTHGRLLAVGDGYRESYDYSLRYGRWFTRTELTNHGDVCILGSRISERLFGKGVNPVGRMITANSRSFEVIGMTFTKTAFERRSMECLIPYIAYTDYFGRESSNVDEVVLRLRDSDNAYQARTDLRKFLLSRHRGIEDFEVEISVDKIKEMQNASMGIQIVLFSIAAISLLVGGISIMNIMFATIGDRIREIGVRKALGAKRADIFIQFIIEAVAVCCVGGIPGMLLGGLITLTPAGVFPFSPQILLMDYVVAIGFTLLTGFFSGLFPALKAANMEVVDALRY
jgi:putative ABC transport system permease protein